MAQGYHPFPSRTRKLSPAAPVVPRIRGACTHALPLNRSRGLLRKPPPRCGWESRSLLGFLICPFFNPEKCQIPLRGPARTKNYRGSVVDNLIPILYLKGVGSGDMSEALASIVGPDAAGLSATKIVRLKAQWEQDYQAWSALSFKGKSYMYFWVDGIHFNIRLEEERGCILVVMGADATGKKELLAVSDGDRESKASWREILLDLKRRGLESGPKLAVGDGALGFWAALREVYPGCREQRCWVHKTASVLDKMPKSVQGKAKAMLHEM